MATLVIKSQGTGDQSNGSAPNSVLYDQLANWVCEVWLDQDNDPANPTDAFDTDASQSVGEYDLSTSSWDLFGPDGLPVQLAPGTGNPTTGGTVANPQVFTPNLPGRWLVRVNAQQWVQDPNGVPGTTILNPEADEFTVLFEVTDANVLGADSAEHPGQDPANWSTATSAIAAGETTEYDADEGWARSVERYLNTVSKSLGGRRIASGQNRSGSLVDIGKPVTLDANTLYRWKGSDVSLEDFQNYNLQYDLIDATMASIKEAPIFLTLHDAVPNGERSYLLVDGVVPYSTNTLDNGAAASVGDRVYISDGGFLTSDITQIATPANVRVVGVVLVVGSETGGGGNIPGSIWFHGSTTMLPGVVHGPISSQDEHLVRWDGTTGQLIKDSDIHLSHAVPHPTVMGEFDATFYTTNAVTSFHILPHGGANPPSAGLYIDGHGQDSGGNNVTFVGINTRSPEGYLDISGDNFNDHPMIVLSESGTNRWNLEADWATAGHPVICKNNSGVTLMAWQTGLGQYVGVGDAQPQKKLHISHADGQDTATIRLESTGGNINDGSDASTFEFKHVMPAQNTERKNAIDFGTAIVPAAARIEHVSTFVAAEHDEDRLSFYIYDEPNAALVEHIRIINGGVAVGAVVGNPTTDFHVFGDGYVSNNFDVAQTFTVINGDANILGGNLEMLVGSANLTIGDVNLQQGSVNVALGDVNISTGHANVAQDVTVGGNVYTSGTQSYFGVGGATAGKTLTVHGDLKVTGIIDPIGLVFDETDHATNLPAGANAEIDAAQGAIFVADGSDAALTQNMPYYKDETGTVHQLVGGGGGGGGNVNGPANGSSVDNAITRWDGVLGAALADSRLTLTHQLQNNGVGADVFLKGMDGFNGVLGSPDTLHIEAGIGDPGSLNYFTSPDLYIKGGRLLADSNSGPGAGAKAGSVYIEGGFNADGFNGVAPEPASLPGDVVISGGMGTNATGSTTLQTLSASFPDTVPGTVNIVGGNADANGVKDGGSVRVNAGGSGGGAPGTVLVTGGNALTPGGGVDGGDIVLHAGHGDDFLPNASKGGSVELLAGTGIGVNGNPDDISFGGDLRLGAGDGVRGGDIIVRGGKSQAGGSDGVITFENPSFANKVYLEDGVLGVTSQLPSQVIAGQNWGWKSNTFIVDGDVGVTGLLDPTGLVLKTQAGNPATAKGAPSNFEQATLWMDNNFNLKIGTNTIGSGLASEENVWQTALNCTVMNHTQGTVGQGDGPEFTDPISGNTYITHYGCFGANSGTGVDHHGQSAVLPFGAEIIGVSYRYNHTNAINTGEGSLRLRVGVLPSSDNISADPNSFGNAAVWYASSEVAWSGNGTWPQSIKPNLNIPVAAGQSIAVQVIEDGTVLDSGAEVTCVIWLRGQTQATVGGGHVDLKVIDPTLANPTSPYLVQPTDEFIAADLGTGLISDVVIELPSALDTGRTVTVKDAKGLSGGRHDVVVNPPAGLGQTIDGLTTIRYTQGYGSATFVADGSNWLVI